MRMAMQGDARSEPDDHASRTHSGRRVIDGIYFLKERIDRTAALFRDSSDFRTLE